MKLEDITLNHIKILKTVNDCQSFSKAAKKLGYSQALISKKVKQLEDYFGTRLLTRSPGLVCLTNKGKKLVAKTHGFFDGMESLQQEFQASFNGVGEEIVVGITPLLSEAWFEKYTRRFNMCFPGKDIKKEVTLSNEFSPSGSSSPNLLINNSSAYRESHPCNRLQTYRMLLIDFNVDTDDHKTSTVSVKDIDFSNVFLLEEVYRDLLRNRFIDKVNLSRASTFIGYTDVIESAIAHQKSTILPECCLIDLKKYKPVCYSTVRDTNEYGIYIHVPLHSELLVLAEGLVRSFRLEQDILEESYTTSFQISDSSTNEIGTLRLGIQRDSIGQLIAGHGVKYISEILRSSSLDYTSLKNLEISREFELQISLFTSGELMNRQMKKGELDICVMDDISLLNNGSLFFDDLSFGSKLIGIASYNILGQDISIVLPKTSHITSVQELKGTRISTPFGSNSHRFIINLLNLCGININADCTLIDEDPRTASNSLATGSIDAHICCETFATLLEEYNYSRRLYQAQDFNIRLPSLRGIVCRSQFIRDNPKYVIAYLHNLAIANHWFLTNPVDAAHTLSRLINVNSAQVLKFFSSNFGTRIDPTLKPQWSWLLKTLNRRLEGNYGISKFDVDFWIDDYFLRLTYNLLGLDYHFQQVSFSSELSNSYFVDEQFSKYMEVLNMQLVS
ncbi:MAG: LysR family transcriptional regulator [Elainellaceae cyanobacterium]